jgi:hypothetical protein
MTAHPEQLGPMIVEERPRPIFRAGERDDLDVEVRLLRERHEPRHGDAAFRRRQVESAVVHRQRPDDGEPQGALGLHPRNGRGLLPVGHALGELTADAANPFIGAFRINVNLFDPDTGTTAQDPFPFPGHPERL